MRVIWKWVGAGYFRVRNVFPVVLICDEKEETRGTTVTSRKLLIAIKEVMED